MKVLYEEHQRMFKNFWQVVVGLFSIGTVILVYHDLEEDQPGEFWIWCLVIGSLLITHAVMIFLKLHIKITAYDVRYKYSPFINSWRIIEKEQIKDYFLTAYSWMQYGGWGIRYSIKNGDWAYTVFNKHVLIIKRHSKSNIRLGTNNPEAVQQAMRKMMKREDG